MSGYRNLHREQIESTAIWNVATSPLLQTKRSFSQSTTSKAYRAWTASADGLVRAYHVREKGMGEKQQDSKTLDASALSMTCTHVLLGTSQTYNNNDDAKGQETTTIDSPTATTALGCTQISVVRNYVGDDDTGGDLVVTSLEMSGVVRIWVFSENEDAEISATTTAESSPQKRIRAIHEFTVDNATGTVLMLCPPKNWASAGADLTVAVGCLDGTVAIVATGIMTPQRVDSNKPKEPTPPGTVVDRLGSRGSSIPLSITIHPSAPVLAVGRDGGQVDILTSSVLSSSNNNYEQDPQQQYRRHRLRLPGYDQQQIGSPIRALTYAPDGAMLAAGNDGGMMAIWDVSRPGNAPPALVHHVLQAHSSWILDIASLSDSRRWVTCGADNKIHVWRLDQMYQPLHTFDSDQTVWTLALTHQSSGAMVASEKTKISTRCACGTETGWIQILSLDG